MSSRALRKLQQEKELSELPGEAPSDDDVSIIRPASSSRAKMPNPFDLVSQFVEDSDDSCPKCPKLRFI